MRHPILIGLVLCAAGACADRREDQTPDAAAPSPAAQATDGVVDARDADFVGVWAPTPEQCARNETWRLTTERLAGGGLSCAIEGAARSAQGWSLQAICTGGPTPTEAALSLTRAGEPLGSSVQIQGGPFTTPVTLVRCTPPLSGAGGG